MPHSMNEIRELSQAKKPLREFDCKRFKVCRILCGDSLSLFSELLTDNFSRRGHLHKLGVWWCCLQIIWTWREESSILSDNLWCLYTWRDVVPLVTWLVWKRSKNNQHSRQLRLGIRNFLQKEEGRRNISSDRRTKLSTNSIHTTNIPPMKYQLSNSVDSKI